MLAIIIIILSIMGIIRPSLVSPQEIIHIKASLIIYGSRISLMFPTSVAPWKGEAGSSLSGLILDPRL